MKLPGLLNSLDYAVLAEVTIGVVSPHRTRAALIMFRVVLQPEEQEILHVIREGNYPACMAPGPLLLRLMALRMLVCDEHGGPQLTELAEAALLRMSGELH